MSLVSVSPMSKKMVVYVHAVGTAKTDARPRREFVYSGACTQCGTPVDASKHVAAHVLRYDWPWCVPCVGTLTLVTTCRSCNSKHQVSDESEPCCFPGARFWTWRPLRHGARLGRVWRCWCWRYDARKDGKVGRMHALGPFNSECDAPEPLPIAQEPRGKPQPRPTPSA